MNGFFEWFTGTIVSACEGMIFFYTKTSFRHVFFLEKKIILE